MRSTTRLLVLLAAAALGACADRSEPHAHEAGRPPFRPPELGDRGRPVLSFVNGDFETGNTSGWTVSLYRNTGLSAASPTTRAQLNLQAPNASTVNRTSVKTAPAETLLAAGVAATATLKIPKYGTHAVVVNELGNNRNVNAIKQSMTVTNADVDPNDGKVHVRFALAPVLENPGHTAVQQPYFWATLTNVTKANAVLFYTFNYANQAGVPWKSTTDPADGEPVLYTDWQSFDISPGAAQLAVGDTVELEIIAAGCSQAGHYGHVYLDGIGAYLPGLAVAATAPASVNTGSTLTYTFRYSNNGIDAAPSTVVTAVLPTGTTFASFNAPGATCTTPAVGATGTVTCNVGTVNPASSGTFTVTVNVTAGSGSTISNGNYTIAATGVSALIGPLVTTSVTAGTTYVDLATTATDGVAALNWGSTTTYTVVVRNNGPSGATGATIAVPVPANVTAFSAWTCTPSGGAACGAASGTGAVATTANLPSGGQVSYALTAAVASGTGASSISLQATATAPAGTTDSTPSNNVAVDFDDVGTLRSLTVSKAGAGAGTVLSSPPAISCGAACVSQAAVFLDGASVVLTSSTAAGNRFTAWTAGPCAGSTSPTCAVTMSSDLTATASFVAGDWLVTGSVPAGSGTVSCDSPRLNGQGSDCTITPAARYRLTALTDNGTGVLGSVAGGAYAIASVTADHTVVATFTANSSATSVAANPVSPSTLGQAVTLTATAAGVAPAGTPGGTVDFFAGSTPLCVGVALSAGAASCTTSTLPVGGHLVTAVSSGDLTWPGSTSAALAYTVDQGSAALALSASPGTPSYGQPVTLTATATGPAGAATPGGTVTFRVDGVAVPGCAAVPLVGGVATCVTTALPAGSPAITVDYGGDASYLAATAAASLGLTVDKAPATVTLGALAQSYDGAANPVTVVTSPGGLAVVVTYDGSTTPPTAPGTYAVVATVVDPSYQGSATGTLVVAKADAGLVLGSLAQTYSGGPLAATATTTPPGLGVTFTYDGAPTPPTAPGSYTVVATISDPNYQGSATGTLVIAKAAATVTLGSLALVYDGTPRSATATTTPAGLTVTSTYDGGATAPVNAGSYAVVGTISDANYQGSASGTLVVGKAAATVTLGGLSQTYDGTARLATATTTPAGLPVAFTYDGSATAPTGAGSYAVVATISDANHQGSSAGTLVVGKAAATVLLGGLSQPYAGLPRVASATTLPPGLTVTFTYGGSASAPSAVGSYAVVGTIVDANYQGAASGLLEITRGASVVTLTSSVNPSVYLQPVVLTATVTGAAAVPTGNVTFTDGIATLCSAARPLAGGVASCTTSALSVGPHAITASYSGDATYDAATGGLAQAVDAASTTTSLSASTASPTYGQAMTLTASVGVVAPGGGSPGGTVAFAEGATTYCPAAPVSGGVASCLLPATLAAGPHAFTATYGGTAQHAGSSSADLPRTVARAASSVQVTTSGSPSTYGAPVTFTATVGGPAGAPTGQVTFTDGPRLLCADVALDAGVARCTTSALTFGSHLVTAAYAGDANHAAATAFASQSVDSAAPSVAASASPSPATYGGVVTLGVAVSGVAAGAVPTGPVVFTEAGTTLCSTSLDAAGAASCTSIPLAAGDHPITAQYLGDGNYQPASASLVLTVARAPVTVTLASSANPTTYGVATLLTATVGGPGGTPGGTVTFRDGATVLCGGARPLAAGLATCTLGGAASLGGGAHTLTATYEGAANYQGGTSAPLELTVARATPALALATSPNPSVFGGSVTFTATLGGAGVLPTGEVTFTVGALALCGPVAIAGGVASCSSSALLQGLAAITATYGGDGNYQGGTATQSQTVRQAPAITTLTAAPSPSVFGQDVVLTVRVGGVPGASVPATGQVTIIEGSVVLCGGPLDLVNGDVTCHKADLGAGDHELVALYSGDANYAAGGPGGLRHTVRRAATEVALAVSPAAAVHGEPLLFTATVAAVAPGAGLPTGPVDFYDGAVVIGTGLLDQATGEATFTLLPGQALAAGDHVFMATYQGDGSFEGSASPPLPAYTIGQAGSLVAVTSIPSPSVFGEAVAFTIDVLPLAPGGGTPGGTVSVTVDGGAPFDLPLTGGAATFSSAALGVGTHAIEASYPGDGNFFPSAGRLDQRVDRSGSAVAGLVDLEPSVYGQRITVTASVGAVAPGAGTPSGEVRLLRDGTPVATGLLDPTGTARLSVATLPVGRTTLTLDYAGDGRFLASQSALEHLVLPAFTEVTLDASALLPVYGEPVTLSATVTPAFFGVGAPTGQVTFLDGSTVLQVEPLDAFGRAAFTATDLAPGAHLLRAVYQGDGNFLDNESLPVQVVVGPASISLGLAVGPNPSLFSEPVTWSVQALAAAPSLATPTGLVDILEGTTVLATLPLDASGHATGAAPALEVGAHALTARYRDGAHFVALGSAGVTQRVVQAPTSVTVASAPSPSTFGTQVTLRAQVAVQVPATVAPTGLVSFLVDGLPVGSAALDGAGAASVDLSGLATGPHQVVASYLGDGHAAAGDSAPVTHLVSPADTTTTVAPAPATAVWGQPVVFTATVTSSAGTPSGQVDFLDRGVAIGSGALDATGRATFATSALPVGSHDVSASYLGDADHRASTSLPSAARVLPASTTTTLAASLATAVTGQPVTLTATVTPVAPGAGTPAGQVTFRDGAVDLGTAPVDPASRQATLVVTTLAVGPHGLSAAYPGDGRFADSTSAPALALQVAPADVTVVVTTDPPGSALGQPVTVSVTVAASAPGGGTPTGEVSLSDGGTGLGTITLAGGSGTRPVTLGAGPHTLVASYAGDPGYHPGSGEVQHLVARATSTTTLATSGSPSTFGQPVTLTATVSPGVPGFGEPGGTVTFKDGEAVLGAAPIGPGAVATLTTALAGGRRTLAAEYGGDGSFAPSRGAATQDVQAAAVAIEVLASPTQAQFGQPVTLTITLTSPTPGAGVPGGTVTVHDGLTLVGTFPLTGGVATVTLDALAVGAHRLTVGYAGSPAFEAGSKSVAVQVDEAAVRLRLASSRRPSRAGRPVAFTATAETDHATPTGTVTFLDGPTPIGTAPLVDGVATVTTRALLKGTHPVTARLAAGDGFGAATATLPGGQVVENSPPVAGSGSALRLGPDGAALAEGAADGRLDAPDGTVELWARATWTGPDQVGASPTLARLGDDAAARWAIGVTPARHGLTVTLGAAPPSTVPADLSDGAWHQVALVAEAGTVTVLLDGVEVGAVDGGFGAAVGRRLTVGDGFLGEVDELRLWSTPRTAAALAADARRPLRGDEVGLRGYWRMDEPDVGELFDAGPAAVDLAARPAPGRLATDTRVASGAWRHRVGWRERAFAPIDAGYDADGDRLRLAVTAPPAHGTASADPVALQVGYLGEAGFGGPDQLTFRLTDVDDATGDFTVDLAVERILACQTDADCSGGDLCAQSTCVAPSEFTARAGGCGCTSGGGGALALWSLLALGLTARRRPRGAAPRDGRRP